MNRIKLVFFSLILLLSIAVSLKIYQSEQTQQQHKNDIVALASVEYGLLNVDTWEELLATVISSKLSNLEKEETDSESMKSTVGALLKTLIDDYEKSMQKENKTGDLFGSVKNSLYASAFDGIRKDIPMLTDKVMTFLDIDNNQEGMKQYIVVLLRAYTEGTFSRTDYSKIAPIIEKNGGDSRADTVLILEQKLHEEQESQQVYIIVLGIIFTACISLFILSKTITTGTYVISILFSFLLLLLGITLPMIEIDARISEISFSFLNETIAFKNQVLFYRSKSIYEVVLLLVDNQKISIIFVGILIFLFSVLFPITKLISSFLYLINARFKEQKIIQFFLFKTGKWSMADVFVIAIIMTFVGFEGIVSEQLNQLENSYESVEVLTTNNSSILFGFYAFTAFVMLSMSISHKLKRQNAAHQKDL